MPALLAAVALALSSINGRSIAGAAIDSALPALIGAGVVAIVPLRRPPDATARMWLIEGLSRRDRSVVRRAIRLRRPSEDPVLRAVEQSDARLIVRRYPWAAGVGLFFTPLTFQMAVDEPSLAMHALGFGVMIVVPVASIVCLVRIRWARQYLRVRPA